LVELKGAGEDVVKEIPEQWAGDLLESMAVEAKKRSEEQAKRKERYEKMVGDMANVFFTHGLGTEEEAMQCLVLVFRPFLAGYDSLVYMGEMGSLVQHSLCKTPADKDRRHFRPPKKPEMVIIPARSKCCLSVQQTIAAAKLRLFTR